MEDTINNILLNYSTDEMNFADSLFFKGKLCQCIARPFGGSFRDYDINYY